MDDFLGTLFLLLIGIIVIAVIASKFDGNDINRKKSTLYDYTARNSVMTQREARFYHFLVNTLETEYFIFPQIHLSSLLDATVQDRKKGGARSFI